MKIELKSAEDGKRFAKELDEFIKTGEILSRENPITHEELRNLEKWLETKEGQKAFKEYQKEVEEYENDPSFHKEMEERMKALEESGYFD